MIGILPQDDIQKACSIGETSFFYEPVVLTKIPFTTLIETIKLSLKQIPFPSEKKTMYMHLEKQEEHFLLELLFHKHVGNQFIISDATIFSYKESLQKFEEIPHASFLQILQKLPLVKEESPLPVIVEKEETPLSVPTAVQEPSPIIPNTLQLTKITVHLSREIMQGILGHRGADHRISAPLLKACLENKQNMLRKPIKTPIKELDLYFKIEDEHGGNQILNIFGKKFKQDSHAAPKVVLYTAYYMFPSALKQRWNISSESQFISWINSLPKLKWN